MFLVPYNTYGDSRSSKGLFSAKGVQPLGKVHT